jgi:hypothetical protein
MPKGSRKAPGTIYRRPINNTKGAAMRIRAVLFAIPAMLVLVPPAFAQFGAIRVAANRSQYVGHCPAEVLFTGNINFTLPHPQGFVFNYRWDRSDGAKGPVHVVRPGPHEKMLVVRDKWRLGARGQNHDISETLVVNSGNTHLSESSPSVHIECR